MIEFSLDSPQYPWLALYSKSKPGFYKDTGLKPATQRHWPQNSVGALKFWKRRVRSSLNTIINWCLLRFYPHCQKDPARRRSRRWATFCCPLLKTQSSFLVSEPAGKTYSKTGFPGAYLQLGVGQTVWLRPRTVDCLSESEGVLATPKCDRRLAALFSLLFIGSRNGP